MKMIKSMIAVLLVIVMLPLGVMAEGRKRGLKKGDSVTSTVSDNYAENLNVNIYNESGSFESGIDSMSDINDTNSETGFNFANFNLSENTLFVNGTSIPIKVTRKGEITGNAFGDSENEVYEFEQGLAGQGDVLASLLGEGYDAFVKETRDKTIDTFSDMVDSIKNGQEDLQGQLKAGLSVLADILEMSGVKRKNMQDELNTAIANAYDTLQTWAMDIEVPVQTITDDEMWRRINALRAQMIAEAERTNALIANLNSYATGHSQVVKNQHLVNTINNGETVQVKYSDKESTIKLTAIGGKNVWGGKTPKHNTVKKVTPSVLGEGSYAHVYSDVDYYGTDDPITSYDVARQIQGAFVRNVQNYDPTKAASGKDTLTGSEYKPTAETVTWDQWSKMPLDVKATYPAEVREHFSRYDAIYNVQQYANGESILISADSDAAIEEVPTATNPTALTQTEEKMLKDPNNQAYIQAMQDGTVPSYVYVTDPLLENGQKSFGDEMADIIESEVFPNTILNEDAPKWKGVGFVTPAVLGDPPMTYVQGAFGELNLTPYYDRDAFVSRINQKRAEYAAAGKVFDLDPNNPDHFLIVAEIEDAVVKATPVSSSVSTPELSAMGFDMSDISHGEITIPNNGYNYEMLPKLVNDIEEAHKTNKSPAEIGRMIDKYTFYNADGTRFDMTPLKNQILGKAEAGEDYRLLTSTSTSYEQNGYEYGYVNSNPSTYIDLAPYSMDEAIIELNAAMKDLAEENGMETTSVGIGTLQIPGEQDQIDGFANMTTELSAAITDPTVDVDAIVEKYNWLTLYDENGNEVPVSSVGAVYKTAQGSSVGTTEKSKKLTEATDAFANSAVSPVTTQSQDNLSNMAFDITGFMYIAEDETGVTYEKNEKGTLTICVKDVIGGGEIREITISYDPENERDWLENKIYNNSNGTQNEGSFYAGWCLENWGEKNPDAILCDKNGEPLLNVFAGEIKGSELAGGDFTFGLGTRYQIISVGNGTRNGGKTEDELWETVWQDEELWDGVWDDPTGSGIPATYIDIGTYMDSSNGHSNSAMFTIATAQTGYGEWAREHRGNGYLYGNVTLFDVINEDGSGQAAADFIEFESPNASYDFTYTGVDANTSATLPADVSSESDGVTRLSIIDMTGTHKQGHNNGATAAERGTTVISLADKSAWTYEGIVSNTDYARLVAGSYGDYVIKGPKGERVVITQRHADRLVYNLAKKIAKRCGYVDETPEMRDVCEKLVKCMIIPTQGNQTRYFSVVIDERKLIDMLMPTSPLTHGTLCELLGIEPVSLGDLMGDNIPKPTITVDPTQVTTDTMREELEEIYETYIHGDVSDEEYKWMVPVLDLALDMFGTEEEKAEHEARVKRIEEETGRKVTREEYTHQDDDTNTDTGEDDKGDQNNPGSDDQGDQGDQNKTDGDKPYIETSQDLINYLISMGIDPSTIPEEITIEWLKENIPPEEYTNFFGNVEFKMTRYTRIQRSDINITETDAYKRKNSSYIWTVIGDGTQLFHQSSPQTSVTVVLYNTVTEVSADIDVMRYCTTTVSYSVMDCVTIDALNDLVIYSKTIQGDGENGLAYKRVDIVDCDPINVLYNVYVIEEEEETNEDNGGWPDGGGGDGDGDGNGDDVYTIILRIIHTLDSISGKWYNGMRRDEYNGLMFFYYVFNTNQSYTYRVN